MSSSPIAPHFPMSSPSRDSPNAHPYAIKTSSSAVLTRSNSVGHRDSTSHHYTPLSPSKDPFAAKKSRYVPTHRHTRSTSSGNDDIFAKPPPVPLPPSSSVLVGLANKSFGEDRVVSDGEGIPPTPPMTWRVKRSETLPSVFPTKSDSEISVQDLPENPKIWTPSQLSVYLSSSLRLKGDVKLPVPVTRDIATFVIKEHLSGRAFLRMKREDYDDIGINQLWKDALLDASRTLRQNIVQGRIMGFGSGSPLSPRSMDEMPEQDEEDDPSAGLPAYSPLDLNRRRVPAQWEGDKGRADKTNFRAGRVRGMVESYERSVSGSSASGSDDEDEDKLVTAGKIVSQELVDEPDGGDAGFASGELTSASEDEAHDSRARLAPSTSSPSITPEAPSATPGKNDPPATPFVDDPPSVEDLLRDQEQNDLQGKQYQSWGAKAWEDESVHTTAKRIPPSTHAAIQRTPLTEWQKTMPRSSGETPRTGLAGIFEHPVGHASPVHDVGVGEQPVKSELVEYAPGPQIFETLEAFRKRLEVVEQRLDELERKEAEKEEAAVRVLPKQGREHHESESYIAVVKRHIPPPFDLLYPTERKGKERHVKNYKDVDPTISGLPRYMFLISLGVVAVVTRVMLRRMIGDKKKK